MGNTNLNRQNSLCPCGSGRNLADCCGQYLDGHATAPTAEALMRSRYSAFVLGRAEYLLATWHASTRPEQVSFESASKTQWLGLTIKNSAPQQVEFIARYKLNGRAFRLHEISRFECQDGKWFYVDGEIKES